MSLPAEKKFINCNDFLFRIALHSEKEFRIFQPWPYTIQLSIGLLLFTILTNAFKMCQMHFELNRCCDHSFINLVLSANRVQRARIAFSLSSIANSSDDRYTSSVLKGMNFMNYNFLTIFVSKFSCSSFLNWSLLLVNSCKGHYCKFEQTQSNCWNI